jgi:hypothetical protein
LKLFQDGNDEQIHCIGCWARPRLFQPPRRRRTAHLKFPEPKLIVAISVDQFSTDMFNEYREDYTGGLKRLAGGVAFPNGYQSHAATETCPGHSTILTGSRPRVPASSPTAGSIRRQWPRGQGWQADYGVYCSEDTSVEGSNSSNYTVSPKSAESANAG